MGLNNVVNLELKTKPEEGEKMFAFTALDTTVDYKNESGSFGAVLKLKTSLSGAQVESFGWTNKFGNHELGV